MLDEMGDNLPGNPFLVDIVIVRFVARTDVSTLKHLRKMDIKWNYFGINKMEKWASKGLLKAVDLSGYSQKRIDDFFDITWSNQKLFRSFRLNFEHLNVNCIRISKYALVFLQLDIKYKPEIRIDKRILNSFLALIAPEIQELEIHVHDPPHYQWSVSHGHGPVFPKLKRFACINNSSERLRSEFRVFDFLLTKGGKFDYAPNLTALEIKLNHWNLNPLFGTDQLTPVGISRWSRMTQLTIHKHSGEYTRLTLFLQSLGKGGMRLASLGLNLESRYISEDWPVISSNLSEFFQTQAKSLEILDFTCVCIYPETNSKIQLPIFEVLHTLKLKGIYHRVMINGGVWNVGQYDKRMFELSSFPLHFPKLDNFEVDCNHLMSLFPEGVSIKPMCLQRFVIRFHKYDRDYRSEREIFKFWKKTFKLIREKFESVVHFRCDGSLLQGRALKNSCILSLYNFFGLINIDGRKLPWKNSLKTLEINGVKGPLKLSHLKGLKKLIVTEENAPENSDEYLSHFKNIRSMQLLEISFQFVKQISNRDMNEFADYFPFPVIFGHK